MGYDDLHGTLYETFDDEQVKQSYFLLLLFDLRFTQLQAATQAAAGLHLLKGVHLLSSVSSFQLLPISYHKSRGYLRCSQW
jgi:hypothetical protein